MGKSAAAVTLSLVLAILLCAVPPAAAFVGGGAKPSEAPTISWGQHYGGDLTNHENEANWEPNSNNGHQVAFFRLPPVSVRDQVVVNWQSVPFTRSSGFPVCLQFVQGANDFNWASSSLFNYGECESPTGFELSGSGTAASSITVQATDASNTYLEFIARANQDEASYYETYPYGFSVEAPRHYLNVSVSPFSEIAANGIVTAAVTGAEGSPAADGLTFGLTVRWKEGGVATYTAPTSGGKVSFQLALPESAYRKSAGFIVGRGADSAYQAVEAPVVHAKVTESLITTPTPSAACRTARSRAHVLARRHHRLAENSHRAHGIRRAKLHRRARMVAIELRRAASKVAAACA